VLPTGTSINEQTIAQICQIVRTAVSNETAVREQLDGLETPGQMLHTTVLRSQTAGKP